MPQTVQQCYGYTVDCRYDTPAEDVVNRFFGTGPSPSGPGALVRVDIEVAPAVTQAPVPPPYFPDGWDSDDEITIAVADSAAVVRVTAAHVSVRLGPAGAQDSIVWGRWLLEKAFLLLTLRSPDRYGIHAGAFTVNGRAVLCTADSGVGKSTFAAWALRRGASFAGDDAMVRHLDDPSGSFFGYPRAVYLSPELLGGWPELAGAAADPVPGRDKLRVQWPSALRSGLQARVEPSTMVFLTREHQDIRPLRAAEAVERCWEDVSAGKAAAALPAVRADLDERLGKMSLVEFGLSTDLDANHHRLVQLVGG
ncbi:hypothetical protein [Catellatospora methionotrophica]|uniref:hypothetical protein n=1 Tax=Catellatospora methionotrophica TaxID=121620 RepID=UPI0033DC618F